MLNRREFISLLPAAAAAADGPKKVAAIVTEYRYRSHADVIVGRFLDGYSPNNQRVTPRARIVSMYTDQIAPKDMSRDLAARHGFKIYPTIQEALTLGGEKLAVDAVLLIGEHGNYPVNDRGQKMYPRYELFEQIMQVYRRGKTAPLFSDKHLSYSWDNASKMYAAAKSLGFPFMAGSSIPLTVRRPDVSIEYGARIDRAVGVGYGDDDAYGFHTLEAMQSMIERRAGGESGVAAVQMIRGEEVWKWRDGAGAWSRPLIDAALATNPRVKRGKPEEHVKRPALFLIDYRDGLKAAAYMLEGYSQGFLFAGSVKGQPRPVATHFGFTEGGRDLPHFDGLVHCIEEMFATGRPLYPVERTLLTTGVLALSFESLGMGRRETPELGIRYKAPRDAYYQTA